MHNILNLCVQPASFRGKPVGFRRETVAQPVKQPTARSLTVATMCIQRGTTGAVIRHTSPHLSTGFYGRTHLVYNRLYTLSTRPITSKAMYLYKLVERTAWV